MQTVNYFKFKKNDKKRREKNLETQHFYLVAKSMRSRVHIVSVQ